MVWSRQCQGILSITDTLNETVADVPGGTPVPG
jgi:hypothetical protein